MPKILTRRRLWIVAVITLCVVVVARLDLTNVSWLDGRISQAGCDRIRIGMTAKEVEAILGGPPESKGEGLWVWIGDNGIIMVTFDEATGTVKAKEFKALYYRRWRSPGHVL